MNSESLLTVQCSISAKGYSETVTHKQAHNQSTHSVLQNLKPYVGKKLIIPTSTWLLLAAFFFIPCCLFAQPKIKKTRILFLLDASSSMTYPWNGGYTRFEVASNILLKIMDSVYSINNEIEFGVRAYGTMYPAQLQNCIDTRLEVPFNLQNTNQIKTRLQNLIPIGSSPIAYSLKEASENELNEVEAFDYSVIFITDGGESCGGDVCGIYQELLKKKISIKPYIIGLDSNATLKNYYACLGNYIEVSTPEDIQKAVNLIIDANKTIIDKPKQLHLVTTYSNAPLIKDTIKPILLVKKDTIVPSPIKKDTVKTERVKIVFSKLKLKKYPPLAKDIIRPKFVTTPIKKITSVSINFDLREPKKSSPLMSDLNALVGHKKLKYSKFSLLVKKPTLKSPKKASLVFEYEEPKKVSPVFENLVPRYTSIKLFSSAPSLKFKKPILSTPKKTSLVFEYEEPKKVSPVFENLVPSYTVIKLTSFKPSLTARKLNIKFPKKASLQFEYEEHIKEYISSLKPYKYLRRYSYAIGLPKESAKMNVSGRKAVLHFKIEEKKTVAKKDTVMAVPDFFPNNSIEFTTEVAVDKETMVEVYFKGTNGKTYPTAKPMILMQDAKTNQTLTSFKRETKGGQPIPQRVAEGTYNLVIKGFDDLYANNIVIKPNTVTKVIVSVSDGTLQFRYQGNIKRPMTEYTAIVNRRFAAGATIKQKCSESLMYEPGTYYVEVSSLPPYKASIDLTFNATYEIQLPEPGTLAIMNSNVLGKIQIQTTLGDDWATFYTMNITGNVNEQRVQLLSNRPFRILYFTDPKNPAAGSKELPFRLNPNNTLELELK